MHLGLYSFNWATLLLHGTVTAYIFSIANGFTLQLIQALETTDEYQSAAPCSKLQAGVTEPSPGLIDAWRGPVQCIT